MNSFGGIYPTATARLSRLLLGLAFLPLPSFAGWQDRFPFEATITSYALDTKGIEYNRLTVCATVRASILPPPPEPSPAREGTFYKRAEIAVDWHPLSQTTLYWFDGSFTTFGDGKAKEVESSWHRGSDGPLICQAIPFAKMYDEDYFKQKFNSVTPLGFLSWSSEFRLDLISHYDIVYSSNHFGQEFVIPLISMRSQTGGDFSDLPRLFERMNIRRALAEITDPEKIQFVDRYFRLAKIERQVAATAKKCQQPAPNWRDLPQMLGKCGR